MIAIQYSGFCMLACLSILISLVTSNPNEETQPTPRPFVTTTFPALTTTRSISGFEAQTTNAHHPHYTYPTSSRCQTSSATCTTEFYQPPPVEYGPTKTIYAKTTISTRLLTCGGCSLTILDPFPGDTGRPFTTTVHVTATRTINTAKCMGTEAPQPTDFTPPIFCPPGEEIPGCSTTSDLLEPSAGTRTHSWTIMTTEARKFPST